MPDFFRPTLRMCNNHNSIARLVALLLALSINTSALANNEEAADSPSSALKNLDEQIAPVSEQTGTTEVQQIPQTESAKKKENGCKKNATSDIWVDRLRAGPWRRVFV